MGKCAEECKVKKARMGSSSYCVLVFLPPFFPPLSTHGGNTFRLYGAVMGASNGEGGLERSCLSVGGCGGVAGDG